MFSHGTPEGEFSVRIDLVPGKFSAEVYLHDVRSAGRKLSCWTYVTDGLRSHEQSEVILTLNREPDEKASDFPRAPLKLFSHLYRFAEGGESVGAGDITRFGSNGFLGYDGVGYTGARPLEGLELPSESLRMLLLTGEEIRAAQRFGLTRVLSRLGAAEGHYAYPPWSDRSRSGIDMGATMEESFLAQVDLVKVPGLHVRIEGNRIVASLTSHAAGDLPSLLSRAPDNAPLAVPTELDPAADSCFVWEPGRAEPVTIAPPGSKRKRPSGCFLAFVHGQSEDCGQIVEDGVLVSFRDGSWLAFKGALETRAPITIPATSGDLDFTLSWRGTI